MKRIFFTQLILLFTICQAFTQDLRFFKLVQPSNGYLCEGQRFIIAYRKTGNFDAGNKMYLNILNASEQLLQKVETQDSSGFLVGILPDLYKITNAPTHLNIPDVGIKLQLSSSLPLISSNILEDYFRLAALPKLSLVERSLNVYSGSECVLQLEGTGSLPLTLKTSDGSTLEYSNISYGSYKIDLPFYPQKTGKYYTQVTNFCGNYGVSGSVDVVVNDNFISMVGLPQIELCVGGMVKLPIMKRGVWNQDNKFLIRFTNRNNSKQFYEIESQEVANFLNVQIPTNIPIGLYTMSVQSSSPKVSSVNQLDIGLKGFTNVDLIPDNVEVVYGKSLILRYQTSGLLPVNFQLNDGTTSDETEEGEAAIMVKPLKTTEYKVADFHNFCTSGVGKNIVNVKVLDGIITEKVLTNSVCEGGKFKILISSQPKYSAGQVLYLAVKFDDGSKILLTGKMNEEGIVEFEFPRNSIHAGKNFRFLVQANPQNTNVSNDDSGLYLFNRIPLVKALTPLYNTQILEKPNWVTYYLEVNGGGLLTVENSMGEKWTEDVSNSKVFSKIGKFFASSDTTFSISKVSNECGYFSNPNVDFKVTVKNSLAGIRLKTPFERGSTICVGSKFTLEIERWGKLTQPADVFLDYVNEDGVITKEGVGEFIGDKLIWTVPSIPLNSSIYLQVRLLSPQFGTVIAERIPLKIDTSPKYNGQKELFGRTQYGKTFPNPLYIENTSPITLLLDSGMEIFEKNPQNTILSVDSTKSSTFIIKTITNFCGKLDANISIHTTRFTKAISLSNLPTNKVGYVCVGQKFPVEFEEFIGTFAFKLQESVPSTYKLILIDINSFKTLYTLEKGIKSTKFEAIIPPSVKEGYYYFQIVDENDTLITSERRYIGVLGSPAVSVTTSFPMTGSTLQRGEEIRISSKTAYPLPYYGLLNDANGKVYQLSNTNSLYRTYANASTTYSIKSFYNECGIQDVNFSTNITVKPSVRWQAYSANSSHEYCRFDKLLVNISPIGKLDTTKYFTLELVNSNNPTQSKYQLAKVKPSGFQYLSFPENLLAGTYYLSMSTTDDTPISFEPFTLSVLDLPKVRIVGSALTMENAPIYVKLVCEDGEKASYHGNALYELSNGDKGDFNNESNYYTYTYKGYSKSEVLTIKNISNYCGVGTALGSVNITTYPSTNQAIYTGNPNNAVSNFQICAGKEYSISYSNFYGDTTTSKFSLEMSDNQGHNFKAIPFISHQKSQRIIKFKMPEDVTLGGYYRFRIVNNVAGYSSAISTVPMELYDKLSATFDTSQYAFSANRSVALKVLLKGSFPIDLTIGKDSLTAMNYSATTNPYFLTVNETSPSTYKIFQVANSVCGVGGTGKYPSVTIGLITGFEDIQKLDVTVGPNPATDFVMINTYENGIKAELIDVAGNVVSEIKLNTGSNQLDLKNYPNGMYLLRITKDQKVGVFKLMKY